MHENEVTQSCPTLSDPIDCSLPGSSVRGIFQARVLEWVAIAFSVDWAYKGLISPTLCYLTGSFFILQPYLTVPWMGFLLESLALLA